MRANRFLLISLAAALSACAGPSVSEAPVYEPNPQRVRVATLEMSTPRADAAAIRLADGKVLICGGTATGDVGGVLSSAELYDPITKSFSATGSMTGPRQGQTITMLQDGRVLLTGGVQNIGSRAELASAEIYDPATGTFSATGSMAIPREGHTATLLHDGRVLVVGGSDNGIHTLDSAEIYAPASGTFRRAGHLGQPRIVHTATLLLSGKVLIAGGGRGGMPGGYITYNTAELYDPVARSFAPLRARMVNDRVGAASVLLHDGRALIVGGKSGRYLTARLAPSRASFAPLNTGEVYDPEAQAFLPAGTMAEPHYSTAATMLDNGQVLVVGGWAEQGPRVIGINDAEVYDPRANVFSRVGPINVARLQSTATLLGDGTVLIAGGIDGNSQISAAVEIYDPHTHRFQMIAAPAGAGTQ